MSKKKSEKPTGKPAPKINQYYHDEPYDFNSFDPSNMLHVKLMLKKNRETRALEEHTRELKGKSRGKVNNTAGSPGWAIPKEKQESVLKDLNNAGYITIKENKKKPFATMKNMLYIFKAFHKTGVIDKDCINPENSTKAGDWQYDFIIDNFERKVERKNEKSFDKNNLRYNKKDYFGKDVIFDKDLLKKIINIINSALPHNTTPE